ncbi:MAG: endonuclease [Arsenicicoccus sp.]|nr:MAG: endonuclease [Arsenicicoccus sp.]
MDRLGSALDDLAGEDLSGRFGPELLDRLTGLLAAQNRLAAQVARTVRECEVTQAPEHDGLTTMASWLRGHGKLSPAAASRVVRTGRALADLPAVAEAFADGAVTAEQVALIAPVVEPANVAAAQAQAVDLAGVDATLAEVAAGSAFGPLRQVVGHYLARLDPDGPEPDPTEGRSWVFATHADGRVAGRFELDAVGGEKLQAVLESMVQAGRCAGDTRTRAQQLADAAVQWADNVLASGQLPFLRTVKPHVVVTIPLADLVDPGTGPAAGQLASGTAISAARARWLACDGKVTRIVVGPESQPLELGRSHRVVPPHLRRAVEYRDRHCVFAGCDAPAYWCDVHHVLEWVAHEGETSLENSALLCERHHTKVHHGFRIERDARGRWHTHRPDGTEILIFPRITAAPERSRTG